MTKLPVISGAKAVKVFVRVGYRVDRQKGSHVRLLHSERKPLTIPNHSMPGKGLLRKLLRDSELSAEEFRELLK